MDMGFDRELGGEGFEGLGSRGNWMMGGVGTVLYYCCLGGGFFFSWESGR